jgi:hypothetical protein
MTNLEGSPARKSPGKAKKLARKKTKVSQIGKRRRLPDPATIFSFVLPSEAELDEQLSDSDSSPRRAQ